MIDNLRIHLFVWWRKWVVEKPVNPMDGLRVSVLSVWEIGTITRTTNTTKDDGTSWLPLRSTVVVVEVVRAYSTHDNW